MISIPLLRDLYAHMEWADALIWDALSKIEASDDDEDLRNRIFHIHFTQKAFLEAWLGEPFKFVKAEEYPTFPLIYQAVQEYYPTVNKYLDSLEEATLNKELILPWAPYFGRSLGVKEAPTTLGETIYQVASHSVHHRAQINLQLRERGGEPPFIDYIVWLWLKRPSASWENNQF